MGCSGIERRRVLFFKNAGNRINTITSNQAIRYRQMQNKIQRADLLFERKIRQLLFYWIQLDQKKRYPFAFSTVRTRISVGSGSRSLFASCKMRSTPGKNACSNSPVQCTPS